MAVPATGDSVVYQEVEDGWIMASVPELPGAGEGQR
jgi:hypothetical protein